jgi:hypothetical protein
MIDFYVNWLPSKNLDLFVNRNPLCSECRHSCLSQWVDIRQLLSMHNIKIKYNDSIKLEEVSRPALLPNHIPIKSSCMHISFSNVFALLSGLTRLFFFWCVHLSHYPFTAECC